MTMLSIEQLSYAYQDGPSLRYILNDLNCSFEAGHFYTILGNSGSGKTTLLSLIGALDEPRAGTVYFEGSDLKRLGYEKYRRNHVGIVFQSYNLIPWLTAIENVLVAMAATDNKLPQDHRTIAINLLEYLGIDRDKANRRVTGLSGGEQQRVAIARSLATNVDLILADEPTGNLDEATSAEIVQIFKQLAHEHNKCIIIVTHDDEITREADETFRLYKGMLLPVENTADTTTSDYAAGYAAGYADGCAATRRGHQ